MNQPLPPRRLSFEHLEDRCTPTFGVPWFDATSLSLSFVPDGTNISGSPSDLNALMGSTMGQAQWQREVLRAYQTWAVNANVNIGLVGDGGQPLGTAGAPQEDIRFGDIRVGARPLSQPSPSVVDRVASAAGFDYDSKTWAGDLLFSDRFKFGIGQATGQYDLFTVALHEAGHSLGIADSVADATSVMWPRYQGVYTGLAATDVLALQSLYGARKDDAYEGLLGNGTTATAYDLTANGNRTAVAADITRLGDVDVYKFTSPDVATGVTGLTVSLKAAGVSLLTAKVTVLNAMGVPVASAVTTDPLNNNLSVTVPDSAYAPSSTYYVKVEGADASVFSVGAYVLKLNYSPNNPSGTNGNVTSAYYTNLEWGANDTQATAQSLVPVQSAKATTFTLVGTVGTATDGDWYKITPNAPTGFTGTLYAGLVMPTNGLAPTLAVYGANGQQLPASVVMNENGAFEVQLPNASTGTAYYLRVTAIDPDGSHATGLYTLGATLTPAAATQFGSLATGSLGSGTSTTYSAMTVSGGRLTQFVLGATTTSSAVTAVRVTVYDSTGHAVWATSALANGAPSTGFLWLNTGTYTVVFNAATRDGSAVSGLSLSLSGRDLTDPIDPYPIDPTLPPPPPPTQQPPVTVVDPVPTAPTNCTFVDPIANPFTGIA